MRGMDRCARRLLRAMKINVVLRLSPTLSQAWTKPFLRWRSGKDARDRRVYISSLHRSASAASSCIGKGPGMRVAILRAGFDATVKTPPFHGGRSVRASSSPQ